jgi:hypothetical protein
MNQSSAGPLSLTRRVLRTLVVLNMVYGLAIAVLLLASFLAAGWVARALGVLPGQGSATFFRGMRLIAVAGIASVPIGHVILQRLLAIVDTVREGDPFVVENAARLESIGWSVVVLELLHLAVGAIAATTASSAQSLDIDWSFSLTRGIAVLMLFVLARVFDHGARMRADLEGTV